MKPVAISRKTTVIAMWKTGASVRVTAFWVKAAAISALLLAAMVLRSPAARAQKFDCVDISDVQNPPPDCPDPAVEPWCACLETFFSTLNPGASPTISQELIYTKGLPTASQYTLDVSGGTLDLSGVEVDDEIMTFVTDVDLGQPEHFRLELVGTVVGRTQSSVDLDFVILDVNATTQAILEYCGGACSPTDEQHSFGKLYEGTLRSAGPGKGFTFEYVLYEPDPSSASPLRGLEDQNLERPDYNIPVLQTIVDSKRKLFSNPACGEVEVTTILVPKVQAPSWPREVTDKAFLSTFSFPPCSASFRRGDADGSKTVDITDAIFTLNFLFSGGPAPACPDAADSDDNSEVQITDPIRTLGFLFLGSEAPPAPGPTNCGPDETGDGLADCEYEC